MHRKGARGVARWQVRAGLVVALVGAVGCAKPSVPGLQLRAVPPGFLYTANANFGVNPFPGRDPLSHGAWLGDVESFQPQSEIFVTRYRGAVTTAEARTARDAQASRYGHPASIDYGAVAPVTIDGRPAVAWLETRYDEHHAVRSLKYSAVIPYDSVSYAVEFDTSAPDRLQPDSLIRVVHSFGRGQTTILWGPIKLALLLVAGFGLLLVYRARRSTAVG